MVYPPVQIIWLGQRFYGVCFTGLVIRCIILYGQLLHLVLNRNLILCIVSVLTKILIVLHFKLLNLKGN